MKFLSRSFTRMLKSKKGMAIESAIATGIVVFSLCSILLMTALFSANNRTRIENSFRDLTAASEIAENYMAHVANGDVDEFDFESYNTDEVTYICETSEVEDNGVTKHYLTVKKQSKVLLEVIFKVENNAYTIIQWKHK